MACGEFSLITRYFDRVRTSRLDVGTGTGDDCALLNIPKRQAPAISTDTLVTSNHFPPDIDLTDLVWKALAINLNDLTAVGTDPMWLTLAFTLPDVNETWLEAFDDDLFELLSYYDIQLIDGDTTYGPLSMTPGIHGCTLVGRVLKRSGAKPGDWIYVTGTPGNGATGLAALRSRLQVAGATDADYLLKRHPHPTPCTLRGQVLCDLTSATIDISDGLISGLGHIVNVSGCGVQANVDMLPYSAALSQHVEPEQALHWAFSSGEDYELCFTVPEINRGALDVAPGNLSAAFTCIGQMSTDVEGIHFTRDGKPVTFDWKGYDRFAAP